MEGQQSVEQSGNVAQVGSAAAIAAPLSARGEQSSNMALVPASSPADTALTAVDASMGALASNQHNMQEAEEAWPMVTKALMLAIMGSQPPAAAATTLLTVFRPMVDGWAAACKDSKRWKERAEAFLAEHNRHKTEIAHKQHSLQAQVQDLEKRLAERQSKVREFETQQSIHRSHVSSLEKKLAQAEAAARAAKEAHAQEAQERKREAEAMAKSAQEANLLYANHRQESDNKASAQNAIVTKLLDNLKENEAIKSKLEERLGSTIAKNTSFEGELAQRSQEISTLQTRLAELTTRKEALERQMAIYQRMPTRRF